MLRPHHWATPQRARAQDFLFRALWSSSSYSVKDVLEGYQKKGVGGASSALQMLKKGATSGSTEERDIPAPVKALTVFLSRQALLKNYQVSLEVLRGMNAGNLRPDLYVHNLVIETCGVCGEVGEALNVLEGMKTAGIAPNSKTYAGIMQGIAKRGEWVHAKDILGSMIEDGLTPDEVIYAAAIRSCFLKRECSFALEVLQMMVDAELPISAATLTSLISACGRARNYEKVMEVWEKLKEMHAPLERDSYHATIRALGIECSNYSQARGVFDEMEAAGLEHDLSSFALMTSVALSSVRDHDARTLMQRMIKARCPPSRSLLNYAQILGKPTTTTISSN